MWINRGDKMNELQICNENQALIDMQIDACNTAINFFETNLSKGQRDFVTQMGKLSLKAKEIQLKEDELQTKYDISEMKENNKFRLATIDFRRDELEAQTKLGIAKSKVEIAEIESDTQLQKAKLKAVAEYKQAELAAETRIRRDEIDAEKEIHLEGLKTEQLRIKEQSKCFQKLIDNVQEAYDKKFDFYESQLKFCMDFFYPQIQSLDQRIAVLTEQYASNFENQEAHMMVHKQLKRLERARSDINDKVESIVANLTIASKLAKLEFGNSVSGYIR